MIRGTRGVSRRACRCAICARIRRREIEAHFDAGAATRIAAGGDRDHARARHLSPDAADAGSSGLVRLRGRRDFQLRAEILKAEAFSNAQGDRGRHVHVRRSASHAGAESVRGRPAARHRPQGGGRQTGRRTSCCAAGPSRLLPSRAARLKPRVAVEQRRVGNRHADRDCRRGPSRACCTIWRARSARPAAISKWC